MRIARSSRRMPSTGTSGRSSPDPSPAGTSPHAAAPVNPTRTPRSSSRPATLRTLRVTREAGLAVFRIEGRTFSPELANPSLFFTTRRGFRPFWKGIFAFARRGMQIPLLSHRRKEYYRIFQPAEPRGPLFDTDSRTLGAPKNTLEADFFSPPPPAGRITR